MATGLTDEQVKAEMDKMVRFIQQEAVEKANEIYARAQEEFSIEKGNLVLQEKLKINAAYEKKLKQVEVQRKIAFSNRLNQARLKTLQARDQVVESVFNEARAALVSLTQNPESYKKLLSDLILQSVYSLMEGEATITCRRQDVNLVQQIIPDVAQRHKTATGKPVKLTLDTSNFLPDECAGGIALSANQGRIRCTNTLDSRLELLQHEMLPEVRTLLFGANPNRTFYN